MIVNLDSESGAAIQQKAAAAGVKTIDYDRLTLGGSPPSTSRSTTCKVGKLQGEGLIKCLDRQGRREAGHRRAQRLADRQQRHAVQAGLRRGHQPEVRRRASGPRSTTRPCRTGTTRRAARSSSRCSRRPAARSTACSPPTTASATLPSRCSRRTTCRSRSPARTRRPRVCKNILAGDQCMTVYKAVKVEAAPLPTPRSPCSAARSRTPAAHGRGHRRAAGRCPPCWPTPVAIYKDNVKDVIDDGFVAGRGGLHARARRRRAPRPGSSSRPVSGA